MRIELLLATLLIAGCAAVAEAPVPREIRPGEDVCEYCHMSADDPSRAAQWVEPDGRVRPFDEVGCLVAWLERTPGAAGTAFVSDAAGGGWVAADSAVFVRGATRTGMGFDVVAFRDPAAARAAGGTVRSWSELREEGVGDDHAH